MEVDKIDGRQFSMRCCPDQIGNPQALQNRPALWIQTIAANFFPRKNGTFKHHRAQPSQSAKQSATGPSRTPPDDSDLPHFRVLSQLHGAAERKTGPEQESARSAAQARGLPDARPLQSSDLRRQSA